MNLILKQFLIIGTVFIIIIWFQHKENKKHKITKKTYYDQYKFPLLVSSIIGLILNLPILFDMGEKYVEKLAELTIINPDEKYDIAKTFVHNNNFSSHGKEQMTWFSNCNVKQASDQQIFTDLPDF